MTPGSDPSQTALMVCAYRARASRWPRPIFVDPYAEALAGPDGHAVAAALDASFPAMELWLALRVAYLDRLVHAAVDQLDTRQVVILGAGYDTRAARLPRAGVRYFEVDHPATQAAKQARLAAVPGYPVEAARYVACDFEHDDPVARLIAAGLRVDDPALVLWEGVVPYLTEAAVRTTATRLAAGLDPRSLVVFDFVGKRFASGADLGEQARGARDFVGSLGEPVRFGSDDILPLLAGCGFRWVRVVDFNELALELVGDYDRARAFRFQHVALAAVRGPDLAL
ncbi:MAG: class I SAM-dependent methyltransferase [Kofleriaceae bacterium]|nr:class I SAM-dependent methyltransferase [Kofleriaceae bacterium]MBP6835979.1 class I SAM-dependent methyltransferase [Kofleriaceae bacterium]MBP9203914.1 class I SAM-dependent methyltransferase [Kofleriaceae bacterium]